MALVALVFLAPSALGAEASRSGAEDAISATRGSGVARVLLVGDSWADFLWNNRSLREVFAANGRPDLEERGDVTAISGSTAAEWAEPNRLALVTSELRAAPTIDVVQLTIGGNDLLAGQSGGGWWVQMPPAQLDALEQQILDDTTTVVEHVLDHHPDLRVLLSLYDYTNFEDSTLFPGCQSTWNDLGQPTPLEINSVGARLELRITALAARHERVSFVSHAGSMQAAFGFPDDGIEPGDLSPPGDLSRPSPIASMFLQLDCFHLGSTGYEILAQNLWNGFYADHFDVGLVFESDFESGNAGSWSSSTP